MIRYCLLIPIMSLTLFTNSVSSEDVMTLAQSRLINDGLFVDSDGTIYCGCGGLAGQTSVGVISPDGTVTQLPNKFAGTIDLTRVDEQLVVTNYDDNSLKAFDPKTNSVRQVINGLDGPSGIELLGDRLYVSNFGAPPGYRGQQITIVDAKTFEIIDAIKDDRLMRPQGMAVINKERMVIANGVNGRLFILDTTTGKLEDLTTLGLNTVNLAFDGTLIYSANNRAHQIMVTDLQGRFMTFAGDGVPETRNGALNEARFKNPLGVAFSLDGRMLYVSQAKDGVLRRITLPETRIDLAKTFAEFDIAKTPEGMRVPNEVKSVTFFELGRQTNNTRDVAVKAGMINADEIPFEEWSLSFVYQGKTFGFSYRK